MPIRYANRFPGLYPDPGTRPELVPAVAKAQATKPEPQDHGPLCFCVDCLSRANTPKPTRRG